MISKQIIPLDWDSSFFNKKIGKLIIDENRNFCKDALIQQFNSSDFELIYIFCETELPYFKAAINRKLLYRMTDLLDKKKKLSSNIAIYSEGKIRPVLKKLAYQAGHYSRFYLDKNFKQKEFEQLYDQWLQKSLNNDVKIISYQADGNILGMVTLEKKEDKTVIGLIGVETSYRGQNIGKHLINACIFYSIKQQKHTLEVYTQEENVGACKFYESCGFKLVNKQYIYHYWKHENTL